MQAKTTRPPAKEPSRSDKEERTALELVYDYGHGDSDDVLPDSHHAVDQSDILLGFDASVFQDLRQDNVGVVECRDLHALLRMRKLCHQNRSTHLDKRRANAKNNLSTDEHVERRGEELDHNTRDDDD
ncbi:hypothetical protein HG530_010598 [Fusarium avenaceum]|nr:hypothetical protein HG530_010598 [Fusarium avenaceum]